MLFSIFFLNLILSQHAKRWLFKISQNNLITKYQRSVYVLNLELYNQLIFKKKKKRALKNSAYNNTYFELSLLKPKTRIDQKKALCIYNSIKMKCSHSELYLIKYFCSFITLKLISRYYKDNFYITNENIRLISTHIIKVLSVLCTI